MIGATLFDLVFVMRKDEIFAAGMKIDFIIERHVCQR
jgi:hypothetical protein